MALAVLRIIIECDVDLDLNALLHESARIYTKQNSVAPSEVEVAPDDDAVAGVFELCWGDFAATIWTKVIWQMNLLRYMN
jgi:hypothetical protein